MKKKSKVYAFIDAQNLNLGISKDIFNKNDKCIYRGWKLDFKKFRLYLSSKFKVSKAFIFIGYLKENEDLYENLRSFGYELVFKEAIKDTEGKVKGNVDAELVLSASAIEINNYDRGIIVSGDGDFSCLYEFLKSKKKLYKILIPNRKSESSLLKKYQKYKVFLIREKKNLEYKKKENKKGRRGKNLKGSWSFLPNDL